MHLYGKKVINTKKDNDQESIQLPNTFRSKTPKGKKDDFKVTAQQSKTGLQAESQKESFFQKKAKRLSKIKI